MEFNRLTVKELKNLARTRGYSGLNRNQLINILNTPILDRDNEDIVLQPTVVLPPVARVQVTPPTRRQPVDDLLKSLRRVKEVPKSISPELNALKNKIKKIRSKMKLIKVEKNRSALKNWAEEYKIRGIPDTLPTEFLDLSRAEMAKILRNNPNTKVKMVLQCLMGRTNADGEKELVEANFSSNINEINLEGTDADRLYSIMTSTILMNMREFMKEGSGWDFREIIHLKLHIAAYEPLRATGYIELPDWISNK